MIATILVEANHIWIMIVLVEFKPHDNKISLFSFGSCQENQTWDLDCEIIIVGTCMCVLPKNKF